MRWIIVASLALLACRDAAAPVAGNDDALTNRAESAHYIYRYAAGDAVDPVWQEQFYDWLIVQLGLHPDTRLEFNKYRSVGHLQALTGLNTYGFAESGTYRFHTTYTRDNHETVHTLMMGYVGHTPPFFNEGVAVAHQADPSRGIFRPMQGARLVDDVARTFLLEGRVPPLDTLLDPGAFRRANDQIAYPVAGSFTRFLIDSLGIEKLKELFRRGSFLDDVQTTREHFAAVYGASIEVWWEAWIKRQLSS